MMVAPAHFGRELPRIVLHRGCRTRIDQRHRACALNRRSHHQNRGDRRKAQNLRPVHLVPPVRNRARAARLVFSTIPPRCEWIRKTRDVNAD
jgi:hypothetical protein